MLPYYYRNGTVFHSGGQIANPNPVVRTFKATVDGNWFGAANTVRPMRYDRIKIPPRNHGELAPLYYDGEKIATNYNADLERLKQDLRRLLAQKNDLVLAGIEKVVFEPRIISS